LPQWLAVSGNGLDTHHSSQNHARSLAAQAINVWANFYGSVDETSTGFNEGKAAALRLSFAYLSHYFLKKSAVLPPDQ
jgi:hypothetical protein